MTGLAAYLAAVVMAGLVVAAAVSSRREALGPARHARRLRTPRPLAAARPDLELWELP